ncbi:MAG: FAD-binding oxidoreductase [Candidatus Sumerlaeia bacterium]|nr:FAD-binding oxidoreductase [Candidatus Sumerlaeia bacterium]
MKYTVTLLFEEFVTHDTKRFIFERPKDLKIEPGTALLLALNKPKLQDDLHPFTPTSLAGDKVLEFIIKQYPAHHGMTEKLHKLVPGDTVLIKGVYGALTYKGPGVFIAGGTGITPFIAILRQLRKEGKLKGNSLLFSNKTHADIILERELRHMLGKDCVFTLTRESRPGYENKRIDAKFLKAKIKNFRQRFYVCGPPQFVENINAFLQKAGAKPDHIAFD